MNKTDIISWSNFTKIVIRTGTIMDAQVFEKAKKPAYKLKIDFGEYGIKKSSAQITKRYSVSELVGKQIVAVMNFPPKQIADFMSECLVLGVVEGDSVVLLQPDKVVKNGLRIG